MFLPEEVDWQFYNQFKPKFLFLPCYKYFTKSVLNLQGLSQSDWGSYELDVHHFLPLLVLDSSHRSAKMREVRKKKCLRRTFGLKKLCTSHSNPLIQSLWSRLIAFFMENIAPECKKRIRKSLQFFFWKNLLSDSYKKSLQPSVR